GGGGRYDKLVTQLGGNGSPAVGYAGGVERLILLIDQQGEKFKKPLNLFIVAPDEMGLKKAFSLAQALRKNGIFVELDYSGKSMKSQMKRADKLQAQFCLIVGESE